VTRELHARRPVALAALTPAVELQIALAADGAAGGLEVAAVVLDGAGRVTSVASPSVPAPVGAALSVLGAGAAGRFAVDLGLLDDGVSEIQFVVRDGSGAVHGGRQGHGGLTCTLEAGGAALASFDAPPCELPPGTAALVLVLQRREEWLVLPVGGVADDPVGAAARSQQRAAARASARAAVDPPPPPVAARPSPHHDREVRLRKAAFDEEMAAAAPELLGAARSAEDTLDQAGLHDHTAKVALCLDMSYSMMRLYHSGRIQRFTDKVLALATRLAPHGTVSVFQFGTQASFVGDLHLGNRNGFINLLLSDFELQKGTFYGKAMAAIRLHYFGEAGPRVEPWRDTVPIYVMFLTDGETYDPARTRQQAVWSAYEPIFWQFMAVGAGRDAIGGRGPFARVRGLFAPSFDLLHELDDLEGRYLNNADFFSVAEPDTIDDAELFAAMMHEYPGWVAAAWERRLLVPRHAGGR
jgi:hypothetical protein